MLDGLQATDQLSLAAYDSDVETLVPAMALGDKDVLRRAIRRIQSRGMTNLHGGWLQGAGTLAPHTGDSVTSRVILLSDGCANEGLTEPNAIYEQCADLARAGVSTSTYGLGRDFNEDLMIGMARHGRGSSYYGQTADDLMDPFREEFELLNALCARGLRLEIAPAAGVRAKMLNDYVKEAENEWSLPDLAYGGEAWAVIRLRVPSGLLAQASPEAALQLCSITVRLKTTDGEQHSLQPQSLALPAFPAAAFQAIAEDELVARRADELEAARLQVQAQLAARRRDWRAVEVALKSAERIAGRNPWVAESLAGLRELAASKDDVMFSKESAFAARRMCSRLASSNESLSVEDMPAGPAYLRRKSSQGKAERKTPEA